ncbi:MULTISPECIES: penicillin-binding protein 1C [Rhodomicrobium]|uniref:penicillin-binding protein 1C n=1 Tax=Rhodomicrobium TaxID=1068 RepID=UPI000B4B748C|nr:MULTISPECIES: penicillin-binding protein 1C [Rhodomicrobium]
MPHPRDALAWVKRLRGWRPPRKAVRRAGAVLAVALVLCAATVAGYHAALAWLGPPPLAAAEVSSKLVLDRNGRLLRPFTTPKGLWRLPVAVDEVDPRYFALLLAYEDRRFYEHGGVDAEALARAVWQFLRHGRPVSGASTLTMQTARLLDDRPTRSYLAKVGQVFRAWQLEGMMSKRQVLELYMRLAPFGGNIEGVRAASLAYFGKEPRRLTIAEAALLVALPQSPEQRRPDRVNTSARAARDRVIERAADAGVISRAEADFAKQQSVRAERYNFPALAAHLSERIASASDEDVVRLTIDAHLQEGAEAVTARHVAGAGPRLSAAAMVIDHRTGEVLAHVGSASYFDLDRNGPIDMTQAVRSPGSALKPFIYGLGFEAGNSHPETIIQDRPARFGRYAPENFDQSFHGAVTVRQALQLSLNIPAVKMLNAIGPARLSARIRQAGFSIDVPRNLSVALGGVGLKLEDLAGLYTALARGGEPLALSYRMSGEPMRHAAAQALLNPEAAWYVGDILLGSPPPAHAKAGGIAFKTGTSYGYRDAWAAGFDGRYVVAVWLGRPDGTPTPGLTGLTRAAPLLFDIFAQIGPERAPLAPPPHGVILSATTGLPPPLLNFREADGESITQAATADPPVHIAFPPDRAELELARSGDGEKQPIAFKAEGGMLPLTWLVNGAPIETPPHRRETFWTPSGEGFVQLSVIDAEGRVDRVTVRLR